MLSFTFEAPEGIGRGPAILVLVIERENMARMAQGDPFDLKLNTMARRSLQAARVLRCRATDMDIVVAYEDPDGIAKIREMAVRQDMAGIMQYLERGRTVYEGEPGDPKVI